MFSRGGNRFQRVIRFILDFFNILLAVAVVAATVWTFLSVHERAWMFPFIFAAGGLMNLLTGTKHLMTERTASGITMLVFAVVLGAIAFVTYHAVGGLF